MMHEINSIFQSTHCMRDKTGRAQCAVDPANARQRPAEHSEKDTSMEFTGR